MSEDSTSTFEFWDARLFLSISKTSESGAHFVNGSPYCRCLAKMRALVGGSDRTHRFVRLLDAVFRI